MGVDDIVDLFSGDAPLPELREQVSLVRDAVAVARALVPFAAYAGIDEDVFARRPHEKGIEAQPDSIALVGGEVTLPQNAGHDAEDRAAVEGECAVGYSLYLERAEFHRGPGLLA